MSERQNSDLRAARVFEAALELFDGDAEAARIWLEEPAPALGGKTPLEHARSDAGAIEVERLVHQLAHGVFI